MQTLQIEEITLSSDDQAIETPENRSFLIRNDNAVDPAGILLVHGFTGTPWEMRDIGIALAGRFRYVLGIRLPGHGTSAEDLALRKYEEWAGAVQEGYNILKRDCDAVVGVGLSTGALLLLHGNRKIPWTGLVLLSPYLKLRHLLAPLAFILRHFIKYNRRPADLEVTPYYYLNRPVAAVHQINRLVRAVRKRLAEVRVPTLVASAAGDITINSKSAIVLYNRIGSTRKEYYRFGREVPHVLTTTDNPEQKEVSRLVSEFIESITANRFEPVD